MRNLDDTDVINCPGEITVGQRREALARLFVQVAVSIDLAVVLVS
jgi:hypothetical protein